jgi:hypothetical protein
MLWLAATLFAAATALHRPQPEVLFAIVDDSQDRENSPDNLAIEPVAMVTKTPGPCPGCWKLRFAGPPEDEAEDEFEARYFRPGRTYRMLAGGAEIGTVKVVKMTILGCKTLAASVDVTPPRSKRDWNRLHVLAVGSMHVPPREPVGSLPNDAEEKATWDLAEHELRTRHVPASLFAKMEGITDSRDLDHDGRRDLIGAFRVYDAKTTRSHSLFLIAMGDESGGFRVEHVWYFTYAGDSGEDKHLVDVIDLDEDGTDEIVVSWGFYESHEYEILKRTGNKWKSVYHGGGSGC